MCSVLPVELSPGVPALPSPGRGPEPGDRAVAGAGQRDQDPPASPAGCLATQTGGHEEDNTR